MSKRWFTIYVVPRVLWCPAGIDLECQVISGFRRHFGLEDTLGLYLVPVSIWFQARWIGPSQAALWWISKVRGYDHVCSRWSAKKHENPSYKATKHFERTFLIITSLILKIWVAFMSSFKRCQSVPVLIQLLHTGRRSSHCKRGSFSRVGLEQNLFQWELSQLMYNSIFVCCFSKFKIAFFFLCSF